MLKIKSYLSASKVHGIGLFAGENIKAGTTIWQFNSFIDQVLSPKKFHVICESVNNFGLQHLYASSYKRNNRYYYITDNARFINHSEGNHNIVFVDDYTEKACRDIKKDEEVLENYFLSYDKDDWFYFEINHIEVSKHLAVNERARRINAKNQDLPG